MKYYFCKSDPQFGFVGDFFVNLNSIEQFSVYKVINDTDPGFEQPYFSIRFELMGTSNYKIFLLNESDVRKVLQEMFPDNDFSAESFQIPVRDIKKISDFRKESFLKKMV
jgi:hypothetical protein